MGSLHVNVAKAKRRWHEYYAYVCEEGPLPDFLKKKEGKLSGVGDPIYSVHQMLDESFEYRLTRAQGLKQSTIKGYERYIRFLKSEIPQNFEASEVTRTLCYDLHEVYRSPVQANRMMTFFGGCFEFAIDREKISVNPCAKMKFNKERERCVLENMGDLQKILNYGREHEGQRFFLFFRLFCKKCAQLPNQFVPGLMTSVYF